MKRLLSDTVKEMFGMEWEFTNLDVFIFYLLVITTTALAVYLL